MGETQQASLKGLWADVVSFIVRRPALLTNLNLASPERRAMYEQRVLQRLGIDVGESTVLNIHRIGIHAPPEFVWTTWTRHERNGEYWPASIAFPVWDDAGDHAELLLLGVRALPLFRFDLIRRHDAPNSDGARYALYRCSGGYPVGVAAIYVRARIETQDETEPTQMFFMVSFDFFGRKHWLGTRAVRPVWEPVHNRVTTHVLNRFKARCEQRYAATLASSAAAACDVSALA